MLFTCPIQVFSMEVYNQSCTVLFRAFKRTDRVMGLMFRWHAIGACSKKLMRVLDHLINHNEEAHHLLRSLMRSLLVKITE